MGTNYYWRHNVCGCCGRYDEMHVGKSGPSFQGHFDRDTDTPTITSWQDWKRRLRSGGELWNEYREREDVEAFIDRMEAVPAEARRRQYDWCADPRNWRLPSDCQGIGRVEPRGRWLCPDGFSFYGGDFS